MLKLNQKGIAHLALIILAVFGIAVGLYLVQTRTNFLPSAQQTINLTPQTAFHLFLNENYSILNNKEKEFVVYEGSESGTAGTIAPPKRTWFYPGEEIRVNVAVSSDIDPANVFNANVKFPNDLLEVSSIQTVGIKKNLTCDNKGRQCPAGYSCALPDIACANEDQSKCQVKGRCIINQEYGAVPGSDPGSVGGSTESVSSEGSDEVCAQVITRACKPRNNRGCKVLNTYPPQLVCDKNSDKQCKNFPTSCDVPEGWYVEKPSKPKPSIPPGETFCQSDSDCLGGNPTEVYCQIQPRKQYGFCKPKPSDCSKVVCPLGLPDGCSVEKDGSCCGNIVCPGSPVPVPSCRPRPACLDSEPRCLLPETSDMCPPSQKQVNDYFIKYWLPETKFDNQNGEVILSGGVIGSGIKTTPPNKPVMATIVFKVKKAGQANLEFRDESLILRNSDSANILVGKNGITITIQDPTVVVVKGDLNGDGKVGVKDFSILLSKWGTDDKNADLNGDGKVNIYDFSILLSNWNK